VLVMPRRPRDGVAHGADRRRVVFDEPGRAQNGRRP
jgi:hypothetical protein